MSRLPAFVLRWGEVGAEYVRAIVAPRSRERLHLNQARWDELPGVLKVSQQALGRSYVACGATHGIMERCNFACSSCYLSDLANGARPLPFAAVQHQLDALRRYLGPAGKAQITSGEVTLLDREELGRIVAYARCIGLDPMVMTNGERLLEDPDYLRTLVRDYGLEKIAIHVDTTQRGRRGMARDATEEDLHPLRERFARLLREVRSETGCKLHAAQTVTVTRRNFDQIPDLVAWALEHLDAFRMISFQPTAEVGRSENRSLDGVDLDEVWDQICRGAGRRLHRNAMSFGHPECNVVCPVVVVSFGRQREIVECVRQGNRWDRRIMSEVLARFGGFTVVDARPLTSFLRIVSLLLRNPAFLLEAPLYALYRLWGLRTWLARALVQLPQLRVEPFAIVVHKFMSCEELDTPLGRERLAACSFKLPVDGTMVSMCEMNATGLRRRLNAAAVALDA